MRKLTMAFFAAMILTLGVSAAYAEPLNFAFEDEFGFVFLNPQPLPP
jgi:hypothetical protein